MDRKSEDRCGAQGSFPRERRFRIHFSIFEGSNEEILGRQQKEEVLWLNVGKHGFRGEGLVKIP